MTIFNFFGISINIADLKAFERGSLSWAFKLIQFFKFFGTTCRSYESLSKLGALTVYIKSTRRVYNFDSKDDVNSRECQTQPQGRHTGPRGTGGDDGADYDDPHLLDELGPAQDLLRQVDRRVPGRLLLHGLRLAHRYKRKGVRFHHLNMGLKGLFPSRLPW